MKFNQVKKVFRQFSLKINKQPLWKIYLFVALPYALILSFIMPQFNIPDEPAHFFRAYEISILRFKDNDDIPQLSTSVPKSFENAAHDYTKLYIERKLYTKELFDKYLNERPDFNDNVVALSPASNYGFTLYIPQIAGIWLARIFDLPTYFYLIFARIFNLLASVGLISLSIKIAPKFKRVLFLLGIMPMVISQISSISQDGLGMSLALLSFALLLKLISLPKVEKKYYVGLLVSLLFLAIGKSSYVFMVPMLAFIPYHKFESKKNWLVATVSSVLLIAGLGIGNYLYLTYGGDGASGQGPDLLSGGIISTAFQLVMVLLNDFYVSGLNYFEQFFGRLGWLDTQLPFLYLTVPLFVYLLFTSIQESTKQGILNAKDGAKFTLFFGFNLIVMSTLLYFLWAKVINITGIGLQGRYLIPLSPFLFVGIGLLLSKFIRVDSKILREKALLFLFANYVMLWTLVAVIKRFFIDVF